MNKDVKKLVSAAKRDGWTVKRCGSQHLRLTPPGDVTLPRGDVVVSAGALGSAKAFKAFRSQMRRGGLNC
jgi:hypothetical protein